MNDDELTHKVTTVLFALSRGISVSITDDCDLTMDEYRNVKWWRNENDTGIVSIQKLYEMVNEMPEKLYSFLCWELASTKGEYNARRQ